MKCVFTVNQEHVEKRLDVFLVTMFENKPLEQVVATRSKIASWVADKHVAINEKIASKAGIKLALDDLVTVEVPEAKPIRLDPDSSVVIDVVFEDQDLIVLNKSAGVVVHPAAGNYEKTLVHGLLAHVGEDIKQVGDALRPGIVHRLDKDTSGLMVVAKTDRAFLHLAEQFKPPRSIHREYLAIVAKRPKDESGEIVAAIGRHPVKRKEMAVVTEGGKEAVTKWCIEQKLTNGCLLRLKLTTGRTHQIRVHLKHALMPILGDPVYGSSIGGLSQKLRPAVKKINRPALHATKLSFRHPRLGKEISFEQEMPEDMKSLLSILNL